MVIVVSQVLSWANISVPYETVGPPAAVVHERSDGGPTQPSDVVMGHVPANDYKVHTATAKVGLLSLEGVRFMFTSFVDNFLLLGSDAIGSAAPHRPRGAQLTYRDLALGQALQIRADAAADFVPVVGVD